jgi:predicted dehydrogenase
VTAPALRVAVAGAGMIARVHLDAARRAGATLVGIAASTPSRARAAAVELGVERAYDTAEELVAAADVDVVHICTPNVLHRPLAELAIRAGRHVVCEKPLATTVADAEALTALAAEHGVVAAVPFVYRYHPMAAEARARTGEIGPIRLVHGHYLQDWLSEPGDGNWRVDAAEGGPSRAFADIGSHWCDLVEWVTGHRIVEVSAAIQTVFARRPAAVAETFSSVAASGVGIEVSTEDAAQMIFRTDRGASGSLVVSQVSPGRKNGLWFEVDGALAGLTFDQENPESLLVGSRRGRTTVTRDPTQLSAQAARLCTLPAGHPMGYHDCFTGFVRDVYAAVRGDRTVRFPTFDDGARMAKLTEAVLASAHTRSWTKVL